MQSEPWRWSATELITRMTAGELSSREAVQSCLDRLAAVNPAVNAVVETLADSALATADDADRKRREGAKIGPLHGVPVTIKVNVDQAGSATTHGVVAFKDNIAREDNPVVANLRKAGAILVGRTNTPAFSQRWFTDNDLHGRTLNPWDATRTPGGSSGGAAAALAVGIASIAHGNDIGGSLRYPAYACGVMGLRTTMGLIPSFNPTSKGERSTFTQISAVQGPMARTAEDLRLGLDAMSGFDPRNPWWTPAQPKLSVIEQPPRVAVFAGGAGITADSTVVAAIHQAAGALERAGYIVEEATPPHFLEAAELWTAILINEGRLSENEFNRFADAPLRRAAANHARLAPELDLKGYLEATARRTTILREWQMFFERYPLLLLPVSWARPFPIDFDQIDGETEAMIAAQSPLTATAILGLPGLSVPVGIIDGLPMGVQLSTGRFQEALCIEAASVIAAETGPIGPIDPLQSRGK